MPKVFSPAGGATEDAVAVGGGESALASWVRQVEDGGIDGVFVGDHVTFYGSGSDGLLQLATIGAVSTKLELQTCVYLLALRHPTPVALQAAMIDRWSNGRLILGVGIGGEDPNEWWACGVDPKTRARRTDESMQILRSLWTQDETTFDGKYFKLDSVRMQPKPARPAACSCGSAGAPTRPCGVRRGTRTVGRASGARRSASRRRARRSAEFAREARAQRRRRSSAACSSGWAWTRTGTPRARRSPAACRRSTSCRSSRSRSTRRTARRSEIAEFIAPYIEAGCRWVNMVMVEEPEAVLDRALAVRDAIRDVVQVGGTRWSS